MASGFANLGVGLGAAVSGFSQGMQIGRAIKGIRQEREVENTTREGMEEARAARDQAVNGLIQTQDMGGGAQQFRVGERTFTNRADAERAAERQVGTTLDYFNRTIAPRIRETYIQQGNLDMANRWDQYTQNQDTRRGMQSFAQALRARVMGDNEGAIRHLMTAYNNDAYAGDGYRMTGYEPIRDGENVVGYRGTFVGPDGRSSTRDFRGSMDELLQAAIPMLSPDQAFSTMLQQQTAADKARADLARAVAERRATTAGQIEVEGVRAANNAQLEGVRQRGRLELQDRQDQAAAERQITGIQAGAAAAGDRTRAEARAAYDAVLAAGGSEQEARAAAQRRAAGGGAAQADPGQQAWDAEQRTNPLFPTMTDEERQQAVARTVRGRQAASAAAGTGGAPAQPRGVIMVDPQRPGAAPQPPARGTTGIPLLDPATGRIIQN